MTEYFDASRAHARAAAYAAPPFPSDYAGPQDLFRSLHDSIMRAAHDAIVTVDQQQRIVMINPAAQRMFGCTAAEVLGTGLSRFIPPEHRATHAAHVRAFDSSGTAERTMAERSAIVGLRANGERFPAEATITRVDVASATGPQHYFTALVRDISAVQGLRAEVEALKARMLEIFDLAPVAIWITQDERIRFANQACEPLFGAGGRGALVGRTIYELLHPDSHEPVRRAIRAALESDTPRARLRERIARPDGDTRLVDIALAPLSRDARTALQMVLTDVTNEARVADDLKGSREQLRRLAAHGVATREKEGLHIAHELHEGLAQQLVAMQLALSTLVPDLSADGALRVQAVLATATQALSSVRRIAGELHPLILEELGLQAALEALVSDARQLLGVGIRLVMDPLDGVMVNGAAIAIYRMVQEALSNVARHARATRVRVVVRWEGQQLRLVVQDNGIGFAASSMHGPAVHGLLGIGERATLFGGHLAIDSVPGSGSRITVTLPRGAICGPGRTTLSEATPP